MRRLRSGLLAAALVLATAAPVAAQEIDSIQCNATGLTYFPRGDHWAALPGATEPVAVEYKLSTASVDGISTANVHAALDAAVGVWMGVTCAVDPCADYVGCTGTQARPNVRMVRGTDYSARNGADGAGLDFHNGFYFVDSGWTTHPGTTPSGEQIYWDANTLAMTTNLYTSASRFLVDADMALNDDTFDWRRGSTDGCTEGSNTCYDIEAVAIHEMGHFLGFNHVQCPDAVMFPTGMPSSERRTLTDHEIEGFCRVYPPRLEALDCGLGAGNAGCRAFGEQCSDDLECAAPLPGDVATCLFDPVYPSQWGKCSLTCNVDLDCPTANVCKQIDTVRACVPGPNFEGSGAVTGGGCACDTSFGCEQTCACDPDCSNNDVGDDDPPTGSTGTLDLCAPCTNGDQCLSGMCVADAEGEGICTEGCIPGGACEAGFECIATDAGWSVCWPQSPDTCAGQSAVGASLNELCYIGNVQNPSASSTYYNPCGPDLICFGFAPKCIGDSTFQEGACVNYCNSIDRPCFGQEAGGNEQGLTCCYGTDDAGQCRADSPTGADHGGCFNLRREGESCVLAENAICHAGLSCLIFDPDPNDNYIDPSLARCYRSCEPDGSCIAGSTCNNFELCSGGIQICCDDANSEPTWCAPGASPGYREIGFECNVNGDCDSGLCLKFDDSAACSRTCRLGAGTGCPTADTDVDGDGVADGGFTCRLIDGQGHCWPDSGPITVDCENAVDDPACREDGPPVPGCCSAVDMRQGDLLLNLLPWMAMFAWRRRRYSANMRSSRRR